MMAEYLGKDIKDWQKIQKKINRNRLTTFGKLEIVSLL